LKEKDELLAGREPNANPDALTVTDLVNRFLTHKSHLRDNCELNPRTFQDYHATCGTVVSAFGKGRAVMDLKPDDFRSLRVRLARTRGVTALRNEMQRVRSVFKFAFDDGLILAPVRFGQSFDKPKQDAVRRAREAHRSEHGDRMFEAEELRTILTAARQPMLTMVLLGINCAFGQSDLSSLPIRTVDLDAGWVNFPRPKTAVPRKCPLWPETIAAIREWLTLRPEPKVETDAGLLFITKYGQRWVKLNATGSPADALGQEFGKLLSELKLKRPRLSFYGLRHSFETIAGDTKDQVGTDAIMGHVPQGMGSVYRERINVERLRAVTDHVRDWLFLARKPNAKSRKQRELTGRTKTVNKRA
jgi:integrase